MEVLRGGGGPGEVRHCAPELVHCVLEQLLAVVEGPPLQGPKPLAPAPLDAGAVGVGGPDLPHGEVYGGGDDLRHGLGCQARERGHG